MSNFVFISGATGGLGKAFAVECASRGWDVFLTDLSTDNLQTLSTSLHHTYEVRAIHYACDLTDMQARSELFTFIRSKRLTFYMLINVAGTDFEGLFSELTRDEIRTIVRLNVESTLEVTHALLDFAALEQPFHIVNVASLAAFYPMPVKATYAASKRFLLDFSLALRHELQDRGATVTVLCPAGMPTNPGVIEAIEAQGIMGQLTTMDIGMIAAKTIDYAQRGRAVYIPGLLNQFLKQVSGLIPPLSLANFIGNRWKAAHKKRAAIAKEYQTI